MSYPTPMDVAEAEDREANRLELLPDDPATAEVIVRLLQDKHAALLMLRRMREERDQWRDAYYRLTADRPTWITDGGKVTMTGIAP